MSAIPRRRCRLLAALIGHQQARLIPPPLDVKPVIGMHDPKAQVRAVQVDRVMPDVPRAQQPGEVEPEPSDV